MVEEYTMRSTSTQSASLEDRVLTETVNTRLLLRPQIVTNVKRSRCRGASLTYPPAQRHKRTVGGYPEPSP